MYLTLAVCLTMLPQGPGHSPATVVINEFNYDDSGTDDKEFVELWNRSNAPVDISGWFLQGEEGQLGGAANGVFTFPGAGGSGTTVMQPGQYLVVGVAGVPNVDFTISAALAGSLLENGASTTTPGGDGLTLRQSGGAMMDAVVWEFGSWTAPVPGWVEGSGLYGRVLLNDDPSLNGHTAQRRVDGYDTDNNGADFVLMPWTPGTANGSQNGLAVPTIQTFDLPSGTAVTAPFSSSWAAPRAYDPAQVRNSDNAAGTAPTYMVLPPSPQGGNVLVLNDPTGGGNAHLLRNPMGENFLLECYVHMPGGNPLLAANEGEAWAIGVGTTDSYGSPVDVAGTYYASIQCTGLGTRAPGTTGIAWFVYTKTTSSHLYLVDMNDGGPGFQVLAGPILLSPGVGDGWQRLRLRCDGSNLVANFGGTFGRDDGTRFTATIPVRVGGQPYFQYRECVTNNANTRPLVIDRLEVSAPVTGTASLFGSGSPTTYDTPSMVSIGSPVVGNPTYTVMGSHLKPNGLSMLLFGFGTFVGGTPLPGAPATAMVYVQPILLNAFVFNSVNGTAPYMLPLPLDGSLAGLGIQVQVLELDLAMPDPLPVGTSPGLQIVVGNG